MSDTIDADEIIEVLVYAGGTVSDGFLNALETKELRILANRLSIDFEGLSDDELENKIAEKIIELRQEDI